MSRKLKSEGQIKLLEWSQILLKKLNICFISLSISTPENQNSRLTFPLDPDFEYLFIPTHPINSQVGFAKDTDRNYEYLYYFSYFNS
jgi:hypothetical protein